MLEVVLTILSCRNGTEVEFHFCKPKSVISYYNRHPTMSTRNNSTLLRDDKDQTNLKNLQKKGGVELTHDPKKFTKKI